MPYLASAAGQDKVVADLEAGWATLCGGAAANLPGTGQGRRRSARYGPGQGASSHPPFSSSLRPPEATTAHPRIAPGEVKAPGSGWLVIFAGRGGGSWMLLEKRPR
jgi:hypothetical protein